MNKAILTVTSTLLLATTFLGEKSFAAPEALTSKDCGVDVRPSDLPNGDYGGFYTWPELVGKMNGWLQDYPKLIAAQKLGTSFEGWAIPLLKISNNPKIDQDKPEILYLVGVHPREEAPTVAIVNFVDELLKGYGHDKDITKLIDTREIWVVPMLNVDGKIYDFQHGNGTTRGGDWRKNRRPNADGTYGVDLNRNFPVRWGGNRAIDPAWNGSTADTKTNIYEGTGPGSEPETQAVMNFISSHPLRVMLDLHSPLHDMRAPGSLSNSEQPIFLNLLHDMQKTQKEPYSLQIGKPGSEPATETRGGDSGISYPWAYYTTGAYSFNIEMGYKKSENAKYTSGLSARYAAADTVEKEYIENIRGPLFTLLRECGDLKLATAGKNKLQTSSWEGTPNPGARMVWKPQISGDFDYAVAMSESAVGVIPLELRLKPGETGFPILIQPDAKPGAVIPLTLYVWKDRQRSVFKSALTVTAAPPKAMAAAAESTLVKGETKPVNGSLAPNPDSVFDAPKVSRPIKVAIYQGDGSGDSGVDNVCARVNSIAGATITRLSAEQIETTDLSGYDAIVLSGGSGSAQAKAIGEKGRDNIKNFVNNGGGYLGICAGAYLACSNYPWSLGILNAKTVSPKWARGRAFLKLQLTDDGKKMFGDVENPFSIRYNNGPVIAPDNKPDLPPYTVRAIFKNEVAENGSPVGVMANSPAVVTGIYGKGRVLSISPHSEDTKGLQNFIPLGMAWLTAKNRTVSTDNIDGSTN